MSDMIYREDAINVLEKLSACEEYGVEVGTDEETYIGKYEAIIEIRDLPSADRPQGEWIYCEDYVGHDGYECSNCGFFIPWVYDCYADSNFILNYHTCPHCDARMKGADDE